MQKYYFIVNPKSRTGKGILVWNQVKEELTERKIPYQVLFTKPDFKTSALVHKLCITTPGMKNIVVLGGDGTMNEVVDGIPDFDHVILGYIPSGSSNDFARSLHISADPMTALNTILSPKHIETVDLGELTAVSSDGMVTTRKFAVSCGVNYDANVCYEALNSKLKKRLNHLGLGKLTYFLIAGKQLISTKLCNVKLSIDGQEPKTYSKVFFAAGFIHKYEGGGLKMAPKASYTDQKLTVCFAHGFSKWKALLLLPSLIIGKHTLFSGVETFDCHTLELDLEPCCITHTDGEYAGTNRQVKLTCSPHRIRIYTPA